MRKTAKKVEDVNRGLYGFTCSTLHTYCCIKGYISSIEFKGIEGALWRKQRIASETGFPLELAVCAVSHLLSPAVAEKQQSKRNICTVRNKDYITVLDATTSLYQKHAQLAATLQIRQFNSDTLQTMGDSLSAPSIFLYLYD